MSKHLVLSSLRCIFLYSPAWRSWGHSAPTSFANNSALSHRQGLLPFSYQEDEPQAGRRKRIEEWDQQGCCCPLCLTCSAKAGVACQPRWVNLNCQNSRNPGAVDENVSSTKHSQCFSCVALVLWLGQSLVPGCSAEFGRLCPGEDRWSLVMFAGIGPWRLV